MSQSDPLVTFPGRLLVVYYTGCPDGRAELIENPQLLEQAGRFFVVGTSRTSLTDKWHDGVAVAAAWDRVESYYCFESYEDYLKRPSSPSPAPKPSLLRRILDPTA